MNKDKMELEESIIILEATIGEFKYLQTTLDEEERELYEHGIQTKEIKAIETVLQELDNSIHKNKIKDKIEDLDEEFKNYKVDVNCSQDNYYELSDKYAFAKEKLQELLDNQSKEE